MKTYWESTAKTHLNGLQANVYYWPLGVLSFGHVSVQIKALESYSFEGGGKAAIKHDTCIGQQEVYLSWAIGSTYSEDIKKFGMPIRIELPPIPTTFNNFYNQYKQTNYYANEYASYSMFKNNCAHCAQSILKMAGYEINVQRWVTLRPHVVTKAAYAFVKNEILRDMTNLMKRCEETQKILLQDRLELIRLLNCFFKNEHSGVSIKQVAFLHKPFHHSELRKLEGFIKILHCLGDESSLKKEHALQENLDQMKELFKAIAASHKLGNSCTRLFRDFNKKFLCHLELGKDGNLESKRLSPDSRSRLQTSLIFFSQDKQSDRSIGRGDSEKSGHAICAQHTKTDVIHASYLCCGGR